MVKIKRGHYYFVLCIEDNDGRVIAINKKDTLKLAFKLVWWWFKDLFMKEEKRRRFVNVS